MKNNDTIGKIETVVPSTKLIGTDFSFKHQLVWKNAIGFFFIHLFGLWGLVILLTGGISLKTAIWAYIVMYTGSKGITIGAHRYYTHRSFKATPLLRAIMVITQTLAGQNSMFIWCRDHRLHHQYSDTDGDPHNAKRGFFFSHIGWLMTKKHPYVIELGRKIDMSDLQADWMVMLQKKYYYPLYFLLAVFIPAYIPVLYFGENWWNALLTCYFCRYILQLNGTWLVNSAAHLYGTRPYDKNLQPVESWFVSFISLGEGWHNYHHAFPWDYKAAEISMHFNQTATIIRFFERIGLAYDLKTASPEMVANRINRTGDGSHYELGNPEAQAAVLNYVGELSVIKMPGVNMDFKPEERLNDMDLKVQDEGPNMIGTDYTYRHKIVWGNAIGFLIMHVLALWGLIICIQGGCQWRTILWVFFLGYCATEGITIGAHRYYTHKTFKASAVLRTVFVIFQTLAGQNSMFIWARDHRLHHRYSDTDADPHNSKRGFFFCHIGWLMTKKHPYVIELGRRIDMSDLQADWMVMFQKKYYYPLYIIFAVLIPVWVPVHYLGETWMNSVLVCYFTRYIIQLNGTWLVNSLAHLYGTRPYDQKLQPVESWFVSFISLGEGWHNYHHAFPWDYKAAELSMHFNQSASFIRFFERIGLAYDLKTASPEMVANRIVKTGDGSHYKLGNMDARSAVTAFGPLHPLNPTFNSTLEAPDVILKPEGLPLFHEKDILQPKTTLRTSKSG